MPPRLTLLFAALVVLLALPAAAQAAAVVRPGTVARETRVPAGGTASLSLRCAPSAMALNAAVTRAGAGIVVRRSDPGDDAGTWHFRLANAAAGPRRVTAVLRCVRLAVPRGISGVRLSVRTRRHPALAIAPGSSAGIRLNCGRRWVATGYGLQPGTHANRVRVAAAVPSARGWRFILENTGERAAATDVSVRCLQHVVRGRHAGAATALRFRVTRPQFQNRVGSGTRSFSNRCARRSFAVATGISLDADDDIVLRRAHAVGTGGGTWTFRQASGTERVRSSLVCLGLGARFG